MTKIILLLYIVKKSKKFLDEKKEKLRSHTCKGYTFHGDLLNSFNPELQFEDTESAIKNK